MKPCGTMGRASDPQSREPGFRLCTAALNLGNLHCCSSFSCMNEYLAIDSGGNICVWIAIAHRLQHVFAAV